MESFMFAPVDFSGKEQTYGVAEVIPHRPQHSSLSSPEQRLSSHPFRSSITSLWQPPLRRYFTWRLHLTLLCPSYYSARGPGQPAYIRRMWPGLHRDSEKKVHAAAQTKEFFT